MLEVREELQRLTGPDALKRCHDDVIGPQRRTDFQVLVDVSMAMVVPEHSKVVR